MNKLSKSKLIIFFLLMAVYISLGLPDGVLGSAWPVISEDLEIRLSYVALISNANIIVSFFSSILYPKIKQKFSFAQILYFSIAVTIISLTLFALAKTLAMLIVASMILGLGGGLIDTSVNEYASINFSVGLVNILHGMWGIGISLGSFIVASVLSFTPLWPIAYIIITFIQLAILFFVFSKRHYINGKTVETTFIKFKNKLPKIYYLNIVFYFFYGIEYVFVLLLSSYALKVAGLSEEGAALVTTMFLIGIASGRFLILLVQRFLSSFQILLIAVCSNIVLGSWLIFGGEIYVIVFLIGVAMGPIYPTMMSYSIQSSKGANNSQIISLNVASALLGSMLLPLGYSQIFSMFGYNLLPYLFLGSLIILLIILLIQHPYLKTRYHYIT